jgi:hypothetical protein
MANINFPSVFAVNLCYDQAASASKVPLPLPLVTIPAPSSGSLIWPGKLMEDMALHQHSKKLPFL